MTTKPGLAISVKRHIPIPFPRFSIVGRECLTPDRVLRVRFVPLKHDNDWLSFKNVLRVKFSNVAIKRTDLRNVQHDDIAIRPIKTPKSGLRIKQAKCCALKRGPVKCSDELVGIPETVQNFMAFVGRFKLEPFRTIVESGLEFFVVDFPPADDKIEIVGRGSFRGNNFQISRCVE
ncbi:MAG: hypothetical protein ACREOI_10780 [bacterium]